MYSSYNYTVLYLLVFLCKLWILFRWIYAAYHSVDAFLYLFEFIGCQIAVLNRLQENVAPEQYEALLHRLLMLEQTGQQHCAEVFLNLDGLSDGEHVFVVG